jgi:hypothetical protein
VSNGALICYIVCVLQEEAKQANEAAHHAQGAAYAAQQDLKIERTRTQELQVRCFQAEEQCAKLVMEIQSLHAQAESCESELSEWQTHSLGPSNRQTIIELMGKLFTRCVCLLEFDSALAMRPSSFAEWPSPLLHNAHAIRECVTY